MDTQWHFTHRIYDLPFDDNILQIVIIYPARYLFYLFVRIVGSDPVNKHIHKGSRKMSQLDFDFDQDECFYCKPFLIALNSIFSTLSTVKTKNAVDWKEKVNILRHKNVYIYFVAA